MSNPKVYVGTWAKYNRGSIAGGWLALNECKDYQTFLRKCKALHRSERDPEFMIQDTEDFPDGLSCGDWLSEQDFLDVKQAASEGDGYLADEGDTAMTLAEQLRVALLAQVGKTDAKPVTAKPDDKAAIKRGQSDACIDYAERELARCDNSKALLEEYMQEWTKVWQDQSMLDYNRKRFSGAVRLKNGGILYFEKPRIDSSFCFHDEGPQYEFYRHMMADRETRLRDYFLHENLDAMDEEIRALECNCRFPEGEYHSRYYCKTWYLERCRYTGETAPLRLWQARAWSDYDVEHETWRYEPGTYEKMCDEDRLAILEGLKREREKFDKRLQTYLKRYGTSKIRTWTYWADA